MFTYVKTVTIDGENSEETEISCVNSRGLPKLTVYGNTGRLLRESVEKAVVAVKNICKGAKIRKLRVNFSPMSLYKDGTHYTLAVALALIINISDEKLRMELSEREIFAFGEVGLEGDVITPKGIFHFFDFINKRKKTKNKESLIFCPVLDETVSVFIKILFPKINFIQLKNLQDFLSFINSGLSLCKNISANKHSYTPFLKNNYIKEIPYSNISNMEEAKRVLQIAIAGNHNLLILGPIGYGKSLLANTSEDLITFETLFNSINHNDLINIFKIQNIASEKNALGQTNSYGFFKPFQIISSTSSKQELVGKSSSNFIGKAFLANKGILVFEELFNARAEILDLMKNLIDFKTYSNVYKGHDRKFEADFTLIATGNLCPCGRWGQENQNLPNSEICKCSINERFRYIKRVPDSLINRFDMIFFMNKKINYEKKTLNSESFDSLLRLINQAKTIQKERYCEKNYCSNSRTSLKDIKYLYNFKKDAWDTLNSVSDKFNFNTRDFIKCANVSQTIADLELSSCINKAHVSEAVSYRTTYISSLLY